MSRRICAAAALCCALAMSSQARAQLVINEVDYDQPGTDAAEYIELKNVDSVDININLFQLELVNGNGGGAAVYETIILPDVVVPAGGYFVVCTDAAVTPNCDLDVSPDTNLIQNGAPDAIGLRDGPDPLVDTLLDAVSYDGDTGAPYTEGSGVGLVDNPVDARAGISRFPDGADTDVNNVDFVAACGTPGEPNQGGPCCGNGEPDQDEACDDGAQNGTTECGCQSDCQLEDGGVACGSATDDDCTNPDSCDGSGTCQANHEPIDTACGDATGDDCTNPDSCDGSGTCQDNHEPIDTACGDATDDECTGPDTCDASGACLVNHVADGALCDDSDGNDCTGLCVTGACAADNRPAGTACGDSTSSDCDGADTCDASGACLTNLVSDGTACTDDLVFCNGAEICALGVCVSDGDPCVSQESCDEDADVCVRPRCGNGLVDDDEECDDFNFDPGDGCADCAIESGWACGDDDGDGTSDCEESCGNGAIDELESCDDANVEDGDGCSDNCQVEDGFGCEVQDGVDVCAPVCGDGLTVGAEPCDDGNGATGDGCANCAVEDGFVCDRQSPSLCAEEDLAGLGCGCQSGTSGGGGGLVLLIAAVLGLARRRRG